MALDERFVSERLDLLKKQRGVQALVLKENVGLEDIAWVEAHAMEFPELRTEIRPQRYYPLGKTLAHVLGYVGEISPKQLENPEYKDLKAGDIIGKGGLEQYYDRYLRGRDGYRRVIVDSRGQIQSELETVPPQSGQDLVTTIDLDLQNAAEAQLAASVTKRGTIAVMDPNNGEMLAMASAPSFDPNSFVQRISTPGRAQGDRRLLYERGAAAAKPRDPGPLPAGLDVENTRIGGGAAAGHDPGRRFANRVRRRYPDRQPVYARYERKSRHARPALGDHPLLRWLLLPPGAENEGRRDHSNGRGIRV